MNTTIIARNNASATLKIGRRTYTVERHNVNLGSAEPAATRWFAYCSIGRHAGRPSSRFCVLPGINSHIFGASTRREAFAAVRRSSGFNS